MLFADDNCFRAIAFNDGIKYVEIGADYLEGTTMGSKFSSKILFVRPDVNVLFSALRDVVFCDSTACTVLGPPGIGKSFTAYVFMCTLLNSHIITHVSLGRHSPGKTSGLMKDQTDLLALLQKPELEKRTHVVILDGYRDTSAQCIIFGDACVDWLQTNILSFIDLWLYRLWAVIRLTVI
jgi:hypothetical protein